MNEKLKNKAFFHSKNCFDKIDEKDLLNESEDEITNEYLSQKDLNSIGDFENVDEDDIEFFKLWNDFILNQSKNTKIFSFVSEIKISLLMRFVRENKIILRKKLKNNFYMLLTMFQEENYINSNDIILLMIELDN